MANLPGFCCKYCGYHFSTFDGFKRHTTSHEQKLLHRALQTKRREKKKWRSSHYHQMLLTNKTKMKKLRITKKMADLAQKNMTGGNSSKEKSTPTCYQGYSSSETNSNKTNCVQDRISHQHGQCKIFKSQCQKKYWEVKENVYDTSEFKCSSCSMRGFRNIYDILNHEESLKHCAFCKTTLPLERRFLKHLLARELIIATSMTPELILSLCSGRYNELLGRKVFYCCFCRVWFTEVGYDQHLKSGDHIKKCSKCYRLYYDNESDNYCSLCKKSQITAQKSNTDSVNRAVKGNVVSNGIQKIHYTVPNIESGSSYNKQAKNEIFVCIVCGKLCKSMCFLNWHRESHESQEHFQCYNCNMVLKNKRMLVEHEVKYQHCSYCYQRFEYEMELLNHRKQIIAESNGVVVDFPRSTAAHPVNNPTGDPSKDVLQQISNTVQLENLKNHQTVTFNSQGTEVVRVQDTAVENTSEKETANIKLLIPLSLLNVKTTTELPGRCNMGDITLKVAKSPTYQTNVKFGEIGLPPSSNNTVSTVLGLPTLPNINLTEQTVNTGSGCSKSRNESVFMCDLDKKKTKKSVIPTQAVNNSNDFRIFRKRAKCGTGNNNANRYQCKNCGQSFDDKKQLVEHEVLARHCAYCNVSFQEIKDLIDHRVTKHTYWSDSNCSKFTGI